MNKLKLDLGCGSCKKDGSIGIDITPYPGVDYVIDLSKEPLPFSERSVQYVHSSHFLEHIDNLLLVFQELSRVCNDGAELEFWTPYGWSNPAFIFDHKFFFNEDHYLHICTWHADHWKNLLNANWLLKEFVYIVEPQVLVELYTNKVNLDFALKYYKGVVKEFGVFIEIRHDYEGPIYQPKRSFAINRLAQRYPISTSQSSESLSPDLLRKAINWFSLAEQTVPEWEALGQEHFQKFQVSQLQDRATIAAVKSSKFWKLRTAWFKLKKLLRLQNKEKV